MSYVHGLLPLLYAKQSEQATRSPDVDVNVNAETSCRKSRIKNVHAEGYT